MSSDEWYLFFITVYSFGIYTKKDSTDTPGEWFMNVEIKSQDQKYSKIEIYETNTFDGAAGGGGAPNPDDSKLPSGLAPGSQIDVEVKCTKDALQVYLNDVLQFSSTKLHSLTYMDGSNVPDLKKFEIKKMGEDAGSVITISYGKYKYLNLTNFS